MSSPPAFQFYASDWIASVSSMTLEERGAHITLLAWSWEHGAVPNDMRRIASILGTHLSAARRLWAEVSKRWHLTDSGDWRNRRLEKTRGEQQAFTERQRQKGLASAAARANRNPTAVPTAVGTAAPTGEATGRQPDTQPERQPDVNRKSTLRSPISDLQPPLHKEREEGEHARARERGLIDGADQRRHGLHAWCDYARGMCVPHGQHTQFVQRLGGADAAARLLAWYPTVVAGVGDRPIGDRLFEFWDHAFAAWVGTVMRAPGAASKTERSVSALDRVGERLEQVYESRGTDAPEGRAEVAGRGSSGRPG